MKNKKTNGFTLVELLVTIVIFSFSLSIILSGLDQGRLAWSRLEKKVELSSSLQSRFNWLSMMFNDSNATLFPLNYGEAGPFFKGNDQSLYLLTGSPILAGPGNYATATLWFANNGSNFTLNYAEKRNADPFYGNQYFDRDKEKTVLLYDIKSYNIRYLAPIREPSEGESIPLNEEKYYRSEPAWLDFFDSNKEMAMPLLINISMVLSNEKRVDWFFPVTRYTSSSHIEDEVFKK
ncbi:type II secretion system protein [Aeromonas caviae]|uniref:Type II secretion system protein n=1 Tax=Aeromonas caviae TaxID=648 RepID=A0ABU5W5N0_AERCA|nr:type II secretion system protein [Aeromonas caviae]MBO0505575.1 type II secretion system protein [Aeromonas veronii]MEA9436197.1 type II secretion system protein [Aeromonas caviae]